ncbi:MAG: hypothetical protein K0R97_961, partial [Oerskovia sp.]|nr:hypothetical protein [Oerskovia sp.]
ALAALLLLGTGVAVTTLSRRRPGDR